MTPTYPHHLFSVRVENKARVLVRVAGLFARRGFNIVSLAVAPTDDERFSRMSIVVDAESAPLEQVRSQLDKLVNVVEITEIEPGTGHEVEVALVCVRAGDPSLKPALATLGAEVVEERDEYLVARLSAHPDQIDHLAGELASFGIVELQRSGRIVLASPA